MTVTQRQHVPDCTETSKKNKNNIFIVHVDMFEW